MGFSTSAAAAVIFVGIFVSLGIVYPAATGSFEQVSDAMESREDRVLNQRNSNLDIDSATYNDSANRLRINVINTGTVTVGVNDTDLLIDGEIQVNRSTAVESVEGRSIWAPGETVTITVENQAAIPERVTVVNEYGVADANRSVEVT
jgi:flagellar protein FlaF